MYCRNCGSEVTTGYYCTNCGTYVGDNAPTVVVAEPLSDIQRLKRAFSSKLFLAVAILLSVGIGMAFLGMLFIPAFSFAALAEVDMNMMSELSAMKAEIPAELTAYFGIIGLISCVGAILPIIQLVSSWRLYAGAKKHDTIECGALKAVTTVLRIEYVLLWFIPVLIGIMGVTLICLIAFGGEEITSALYAGEEYVGIVLLIMSILFIIIAAVYIVFLLLYYRKRVRFAKELVISAETGVINVTKPKALHTWLLVMGIISGVSVLSGGFTAAIPAAIEICLSFWIKENFVTDE